MTIDKEMLLRTSRPKNPSIILSKGAFEKEEAKEPKGEESKEHKGTSVKAKIKALKKELKEKGHSKQARTEIAKKVAALTSDIKKSISESYEQLDSLDEVMRKSQRPGFSQDLLIPDDESLQSFLQMKNKNRIYLFSE